LPVLALAAVLVATSPGHAQKENPQNLKKGQSGYFLCAQDADCSKLGKSHKCLPQKYACGPASTCGERVCLDTKSK
jgi:hypothetical protein